MRFRRFSSERRGDWKDKERDERMKIEKPGPEVGWFALQAGHRDRWALTWLFNCSSLRRGILPHAVFSELKLVLVFLIPSRDGTSLPKYKLAKNEGARLQKKKEGVFLCTNYASRIMKNRAQVGHASGSQHPNKWTRLRKIPLCSSFNSKQWRQRIFFSFRLYCPKRRRTNRLVD